MNNDEFRLLFKLFVALVTLSLIYTVFPYLDVLALSCALAYMSKPVYDKLKPKFGSSLSSMICLLFIIVPMAIIGFIILYQILEFLQSLNLNQLDIQNLNLISLINYKLNYLSNILGYNIPIQLEEEKLSQYISLILSYLEPHISTAVSGLLLLPEIMIKLIMGVFITYYFLKDGHHIKNIILGNIPKKYHLTTQLYLKYLNESYQNLFTGTALTSVAIGIISFIGYFIFGVPNALLLAVLTGIFALLPIIGGWAVYIPISIYYLIIGDIYTAIGIFIFGWVFLSIAPDFVIRPAIVQKESDVHPVVVLLAFLVAPLTLGIAGFAIGPILFGAFDALFKVKSKIENNS